MSAIRRATMGMIVTTIFVGRRPGFQESDNSCLSFSKKIDSEDSQPSAHFFFFLPGLA